MTGSASPEPGVVVVVAGGDRVPPAAVADLPPEATVVAADSGVDHALALGLPVHVAVGDFDSVSAAGLAAIGAAGAHVERHPAAKDQTDLELALGHATALGAGRIIVVGGHGGRVDHYLANALLLTSPRWSATRVEARFGSARLFVVRDEVVLCGRPGDLVSLLAVGGPATGVTTEGLLYPLTGGELTEATSRGVSNELVATEATIRLQTGTLLVIQPGERGAHVAEGLGPPPA